MEVINIIQSNGSVVAVTVKAEPPIIRSIAKILEASSEVAGWYFAGK